MRKRNSGTIHKKSLFFATAIAFLSVCTASISTAAWFQINNSAAPAQTAQTRNIQTNATVYQANNHPNDDTYQKSPTSDSAGTLSYDHAKGGKPTNLYIRQWDSGVEKSTLQMFTNLNNVSDQAVYYNIKFDYNWKIYNASTNNYYGFSDIDPSDPLLGSCSADGDGNIVASGLTGYYDVYFTSSNKIWIVDHSESTTSSEMGNETGYYICKDTLDISNGIPMYVNAYPGATDKAYYAGLRAGVDEVFYLASGESTESIKTSASGGDNYLNNVSYFSFNTGTGAITCNKLGYYCVALTADDKIHITPWDGKEVDGATRYTVRDSGGNALNAKRPDTGRRNSNRSDKTKSIHSGQKFYLDCGTITNWDSNHINLYFYNSPSDNQWASDISAYDSKTVYEFTVPGTNKDWTSVIAARSENAISGWSGIWNQTEDYNIWESTTGVASNKLTITGWNGDKGRVSGSYESGAGPLNIVGTQSSTDKWGPYSDQTCISTNIGVSTKNITFAANDTFKIVDVYNNPLYYGYSDRGTISTNTDGSITNDEDDNFKVVYAGTYSISFNSSTKKVNISGGPSMKTLSFGYFDSSNSNSIVAGTAATEIQVLEGNTIASLPSINSAPYGYRLIDNTKWYESNFSTTHTVGGSSGVISANTTYYAKLEALPTCTVSYYKCYDDGSPIKIGDDQAAYQTASFTTRALPSAETGYTLLGWRTNKNGSGTSYAASASVTCPSSSTLVLYACYTSIVYNYYLTGSAKGNFTDGSGSINQTATYSATSITWNNVSFVRGEKWKILRPGTNPAPFNVENNWWGGNLASSSAYYHDADGNDHNFSMDFGGTFNITLTLSPSASITVELVNLSTADFRFKYGSTSFYDAAPDSVSGTSLSWNTSVTLDAGYEWYIAGPVSDCAWGINTGDSTNIKATANWSYYFAQGSTQRGSVGTIYDVKNLYDMTATSVTFDFAANTIVFAGISLVTNQFKIKTSSATVATQSNEGSPGTVTFTDIHLATDTPWHLDVGDGVTYSYSSLPDNVTMLGQAAPKGTYFYISNQGSNWIGTGYGGTYSLVFDVATHRFTSVTCTNLDATDFVAVRDSGSSSGTALTYSSKNLSAHTITFTGSTHLYIGEGLNFKNDNTGLDSSSRSCTHYYNFGGDIASYDLNSCPLVNVVGTKLVSIVDVTVAFTFTFYSTNDSNLTKAVFAITSWSENTDISFNHAENAGIYIETASNSTFTENVQTRMMHTTSGKDSERNTYLAQEAPIYTSAGTSYMRVYKTHSNTSGSMPTAETIRELTEYYYVAQDTPHDGFSSSTSTRSPTGNGKNAYITVSTAGTWTISLRSDGAVHIEVYSGAATVSTEHEVPYYLIGRGMPGSGIRGCDFTIGKGIALWTYGGNSSTVPCYVGKYGSNTDSGTYVGTGIALKKGDKFAIANASKQITNFASGPVSGISIEGGIATVNQSGRYQIYLTGSIGSETINIIQYSTTANWDRSDDVIAQNGVSLISSSGNTLTLGGNLDYSLLDAYGSSGFTFEVELSHVSTGAAGTMAYSIANGNSFAINVAKKDATKASGSYGVDQSIAESGSYGGFSRTITASTTTYTCLRVTISAAEIRSMIASGSYSFNMTISYTFTEGTII